MAAQRCLDYTAFDIAHYLDIKGYAAVAHTRIQDNLVAGTLGIFRADMIFTTVLTSAKLPPARQFRKVKPQTIAPAMLKQMCREAGADQAGFFGLKRFDEFAKSFRENGSFPRSREIVEDNEFYLYCPSLRTEKISLKGPADWLDGAKSVIVLGLHFPDSTVDTAKTTPAETIGPYAFVQAETLALLGDTAFRIVQQLKSRGFRATFTSDLTGLASKNVSSRGLLPDMRANLFPAVLAGLAYPGIHGTPITEQYGTRQRFMAIVSDCPLPEDSLYRKSTACSTCPKPCLKACPVSAIKKTQTSICVDKTCFGLNDIDCFACDWAKRYGLVEAEGPGYFGVRINVPVPKKRTGAAIVAATESAARGVQKRHINIMEECIRVCPAHRFHQSRK